MFDQSFQANESMVSEISKKDANLYLYENFDEDTLWPSKPEDKKINKTIETQTSDLELISTARKSVLYKVKKFEITIPETKLVKDGMIYSYVSYKLVTRLKDNEEADLAVYRRYSDFLWLFEELTAKYNGYIIPLPPPKNVLTTLNQEGSDFSETRRKELINFIKKITDDEFLKYSEEMNCFLFDDSKFAEMKQQSEVLRHSREQGLVKNLYKFLNYATKKPVAIKEMNENEKEIYNQEVFINTTLMKMQEFRECLAKILVLKRNLTQTKLAILSGFDSLFFWDVTTGTQSKIKELAQIEDTKSKEIETSIEASVKEIIRGLESAKAAIDRRKSLLDEYYQGQKDMEEYQLNIKKESIPSSQELERLKKEIEILKKKKKDSTVVLLEKLRQFRSVMETEVSDALKSFSNIQSGYYSDLHTLWMVKQPPQEKR